MSTPPVDVFREPSVPVMPVRPRRGEADYVRRRTPVAEHLSPVIRTAGPEGEREVVLKIASGRAELFEAFGLVYDAYVEGGLARPNPHRMRVTPYQLLPTTEVFVATSGGQVICTMSLVGDSELGLPLESIYEQEVTWRRLRSGRLGEVSCLADRPEILGRSCRVPVELMRLMAQCAKRRGIDEILIAVHPRHAKFYERCAAFRVIGGQRTYVSVCGKPAVALALNLHDSALTHPALYQKFFGTPYPDDVLRRRPLAPELLEEMRVIAEECALPVRQESSRVALVPA